MLPFVAHPIPPKLLWVAKLQICSCLNCKHTMFSHQSLHHSSLSTDAPSLSLTLHKPISMSMTGTFPFSIVLLFTPLNHSNTPLFSGKLPFEDSSLSPFSFSLDIWYTLIKFYYISHIRDHSEFIIFPLIHFIQHNTLQIHLYSNKLNDSIFSNSQVIFYWVYITEIFLFIHLSWMLGLFKNVAYYT